MHHHPCHLTPRRTLLHGHSRSYASADSERDYDCEGTAVAIHIWPRQLLVFVIYLFFDEVYQYRSNYYAPKVGLAINSRYHDSHHKCEHLCELGEIIRAEIVVGYAR